jgi:hypothetical protein
VGKRDREREEEIRTGDIEMLRERDEMRRDGME